MNQSDTSLEKPRLKPCPFCGGEPKLDHSWILDVWFVACKCGVHGPAFNEYRHFAVQGWNKMARREP